MNSVSDCGGWCVHFALRRRERAIFPIYWKRGSSVVHSLSSDHRCSQGRLLSAVAPILDARQFRGPDDLIRLAIASHASLPEELAHSRITYRESRTLTPDLLFEICTQFPLPGMEDEWQQRLKRRRTALRPHVGKTLLCAVVPQPGVLYTLEIDLIAPSIVYWEWHSVLACR